MPYLRKMLININFNGNLGRLCGIVTLLNIAKTFILQMNAAKFKLPLKCISVKKRVLNIGCVLNETNTDVRICTCSIFFSLV